ncbi:MAG: PAS domain-containing protein, partial [Burkholderiales bacterium]
MKRLPTPPASLVPASAASYAAFDHLATLVAVVGTEGQCVFANASFESVLGLSRRSVQRGSVFDWFVDSQQLRDTVDAVRRNEYATSRLEALLRRPGTLHGEPLPVHVIVNQMDASPHVVVELVEIEQQTRQDREERALDQAQVTKELIRNLAHEIKNPLGGIRGAAQ